MSFLNRSVLQERAAAATVEKHPLLKECDFPPNVKQAYLQGCVLAVLERDDGKVTDAARQEIIQLGLSLEFAESDIDEAIGVVSGLASTEDQSEFLKELTATLSTEVYQRFFMADFERLIKKDGALSADAMETVDYIGRTLTQEKSWRAALRTRKTTGNDCSPKGGSSQGQQRNDVNGTEKRRIAQPRGVNSYARLLEVVGTHLNRSPEKITPGTVLIDDLDGVETAQLMQAIERAFGISIPQSDFARLRTVECACQYLGCSCPSVDGNSNGMNATSQQRKFEYIAKDSNGAERRGVLTAQDRNSAIAAVRKMGLFPTAIGEVRGSCPSADRKGNDSGAYATPQETNSMRERGKAQGMVNAYERLLKVVALQLNRSPEKIKSGTVLIDDLDGVETAQLMQAIELEFGICIPQCDFARLRTMECACQYLGVGCPSAVNIGTNAASLQIESMRKRGIAYLTGAGVAQDIAKGFDLVFEAAQAGDAEGLNMLGMCYLNGWGVNVNERKAFQYCQKSADLGFACAQYNVGAFYQNGQGCSIDNFAAVKMYRAAATQGMPDAQNALGMCYLNGLGVPRQNSEEAVSWCRRAANQNHPMAAWNMATFYMNGQGVRQDVGQARKWLQKAASLGNEEAQRALQEWDAQPQQRSSRVPQRGGIDGFWQENGDSITNGLKVAGNLLLRGLFGG